MGIATRKAQPRLQKGPAPCDQRKAFEVQPLEAVFIGRPYDITPPPSTREEPNARVQLLPEAAARNERRLEAVSCKPLFGSDAPLALADGGFQTALRLSREARRLQRG